MMIWADIASAAIQFVVVGSVFFFASFISDGLALLLSFAASVFFLHIARRFAEFMYLGKLPGGQKSKDQITSMLQTVSKSVGKKKKRH